MLHHDPTCMWYFMPATWVLVCLNGAPRVLLVQAAVTLAAAAQPVPPAPLAVSEAEATVSVCQEVNLSATERASCVHRLGMSGRSLRSCSGCPPNVAVRDMRCRIY
jgi:hypothetical protein